MTDKFDNNNLTKIGKAALDMVDKAYLGTTHGKYYFAHVEMKRKGGVGINFVEANSVDEGVERVCSFAKKHKKSILRLRIVGHGNVGMIFVGGDVSEAPGKFIKFENGKLINGKPLSKLAFVMAKDGWVELRGCSVMEGYKEPSLVQKVLQQTKAHNGAELIQAMAKLINRPVRAADELQNAAGWSGWRGKLYEASPNGSVRLLDPYEV